MALRLRAERLARGQVAEGALQQELVDLGLVRLVGLGAPAQPRGDEQVVGDGARNGSQNGAEDVRHDLVAGARDGQLAVAVAEGHEARAKVSGGVEPRLGLRADDCDDGGEGDADDEGHELLVLERVLVLVHDGEDEEHEQARAPRLDEEAVREGAAGLVLAAEVGDDLVVWGLGRFGWCLRVGKKKKGLDAIQNKNRAKQNRT